MLCKLRGTMQRNLWRYKRWVYGMRCAQCGRSLVAQAVLCKFGNAKWKRTPNIVSYAMCKLRGASCVVDVHCMR
eukprot:8878468-Pyramimonas_sp.AAC.1